MQKIIGSTINLTRGDSLNINLSLELVDGTAYEFKQGDKIIFSVYEKNKMSEPAILLKTFIVNQNGENFDLNFTSQETRFGPFINKPIDYWYEIELNDEYTVVGYDETGAKILKIYPEGNK